MARIVPSNTVPGAREPAAIVVPRPPPATLPTLMYDAVAVQANAEQVFRADAFKNTTGTPIEVHSMRVVIEPSTPSQAASIAAFPLDVGGVIALRIAVNGAPMTRGYVPVWNICRSNNRTETYQGNGIYAYSMSPSNPIPLPAGASISVQAKHLGFTPSGLRVHVSFVGRRGAGLQTPRRVPYVVYWQSPAFTYAQAATYTTPPSVLVNDSGRQLNVDRIIGRFAAFSPAFDLGAGTWSATSRVYTDFADPTAQGVLYASLRLSMAQDRPIIRNFTEWRTVFGQTAALETDFIMRPNDYMIADVRHAAGGTTLNVNPPPYVQCTGGVSIVGWREV